MDRIPRERSADLEAAEELDGAALGNEFSTAVVMFHEAIGQELGLSATDHKALGTIQRQGPLAAGELARELHLTPAAITALVDRLAARGLVTREADSRDRRRSLLRAEATPPLQEVFARLAERTAQFSQDYTAQDWQAIVRYLRDMTEALQDLTRELTEQASEPGTDLPVSGGATVGESPGRNRGPGH